MTRTLKTTASSTPLEIRGLRFTHTTLSVWPLLHSLPKPHSSSGHGTFLVLLTSLAPSRIRNAVSGIGGSRADKDTKDFSL